MSDGTEGKPRSAVLPAAVVLGGGTIVGTVALAATAQAATHETSHGDAAHGAAEHHDEGFFGPEVLLALALVVLFVIVWKPAKRAILGGLDSRAERIRTEIDEATRLREEAQAALATFKRRQRDAMAEAEAIIEHARQDAERLRAAAAADLEQALARREALAMERIAQAEQAAAAEVRNIAVDVALTAARQIITEQLDPVRAGAMIDAAIEDLPQRLH